jgi:hypothetical protein
MGSSFVIGLYTRSGGLLVLILGRSQLLALKPLNAEVREHGEVLHSFPGFLSACTRSEMKAPITIP